MNYKCIFFDLDHTLWDYEANSRDTLNDLYNHFALSSRGIPDAESLCVRFREVNIALWDLYDRGEIDSTVIRQERFKKILEPFGAFSQDLCDELSVAYLDSCPRRKNLIPHALEILEYLSERYRLTVVTNGFEDVQNIKLGAVDLHRFFKYVITSQKAGYKKPALEIFEYAMRANNVAAHEVIMVGDNLVTDIGGARNAFIDTAFFNPELRKHNEQVTYEIESLKELYSFL